MKKRFDHMPREDMPRVTLDLTDPVVYARYARKTRLHTLMVWFKHKDGCSDNLAWLRAEDMLYRHEGS